MLGLPRVFDMLLCAVDFWKGNALCNISQKSLTLEIFTLGAFRRVRVSGTHFENPKLKHWKGLCLRSGRLPTPSTTNKHTPWVCVGFVNMKLNLALCCIPMGCLVSVFHIPWIHYSITLDLAKLFGKLNFSEHICQARSVQRNEGAILDTNISPRKQHISVFIVP